MFINELDDDTLIRMSKQYCQASSNEEIAENMVGSELLQVNRLNNGILVFFYGLSKNKSIQVQLKDFNAHISMEGGIEDSKSVTNLHIKNMLSKFGMDYYAILENAIRLGEVENIDLKTLNAIVREVHAEQEAQGEKEEMI